MLFLQSSPGLLFALPGRWTGGKREVSCHAVHAVLAVQAVDAVPAHKQGEAGKKDDPCHCLLVKSCLFVRRKK